MKTKKNQKNNRTQKTAKQPVGKTKALTAVLVILFILIIAYLLIPKDTDKWSVNSEGILSYPQNRGSVDVTLIKTESGSNYTLETISFQSKDYTVGGLLRIPFSENKVPAVVLLPGATVPKEGTQGLAQILSGMGYASLGIDQRNRGGVDFQYDFGLFKDGKEPVEHKMVFDALRSVDVLRQDKRIDPERIAVVGESNGGRFAIITAAIDPDIKGVIGISTSGYDTDAQIAGVRDETARRFYSSIDPETYLKFIPPRKFVMMHSVNDSIIALEYAQNTFMKAKEPKMFYKIETGGHGFSDGMRVQFESEIRSMLH